MKIYILPPDESLSHILRFRLPVPRYIVVPDSAFAARIIPVKNDFADKFAKSAL